MDGLRKVPDNVPNKEMLAKYLGQPLTRVPDPFGTHPSFGEHNNARLRAFLDQFGFEYEFLSSTACYAAGRFDTTLLLVLDRYEQVMEIMLPSLREERAATYSPFLPISPRTGAVLQVPILEHDKKRGTVVYEDPDSKERMESPVTGGRCKLQWKPDWAMRWVALGVDYEMAGKDLIDSVKLSGQIARALGVRAAGGLQLRAVPRREGAEDLEVQGQRNHDRGMAALCEPGEPLALHVSRAESRQAALFRRDPAPHGRVPAVSRGLSEARLEAAPRQSGLAHSFGQSAAGGNPDSVLHAAHAGFILECGERRDALGLHQALPARR